ncbi:hypothetical protein MIT9_P2569 [Methylomarinovum caldicuralii]|uniref:Uncharacterized protein n=1 Tax=Methylomarinovum caldicuralii TaxID=438856 RepID=A0AAU9C5E5_9GAMM|nr:hypothetical protein [Methylomarinovum caldicuralii]BCX82978.1 hypothetical protein MIT9_P2569 [Methylomarinovum caldicuralii]
MKAFCRFRIYLLMLFLPAGMAWAQPEIGVTIDRNFYVLGSNEPFPVYVTGEGADIPKTVDVHLGLIAPDGTIYEFPNWNTSLQPWIPNFTVPAGLKYGPQPIFDLQNFPHLTEGGWRVAAALTEPGTLNLVSLSIAWIGILPPAASSGDSFRFGVLSMTDSANSDSRSQSAVGFFMEINESGGLSEEQLKQIANNWKEGAGVPLDECRFEEINTDPTSSPLPGFFPTFLHAGDQLNLTREDGNIVSVPLVSRTLPGTAEEFLTYATDLPGGFYQDQAVYRFTGPGGTDVGPFETTLRAPAPLTVASPDLVSGPVIHNASDDLVLEWNGQNSRGTVEAILSTVNSDITTGSSTIKTVTCRFVDDGEGVVPADMLSRLDSGSFTLPGLDLGGFVSGSISVSRSRYAVFNAADGSLDFGLFFITSNVGGMLTLQ